MNIFIEIGGSKLKGYTSQRVRKNNGLNPCKLLPNGRWVVTGGVNANIQFDRPVWVGAVNNRHGDMGCDWYVWDGVVNIYGNAAVQETVAKVDEFCRCFPGAKDVRFRYTGRTDITLAIKSAFEARGVRVTVEHWSESRKTYEVLELP